MGIIHLSDPIEALTSRAQPIRSFVYHQTQFVNSSKIEERRLPREVAVIESSGSVFAKNLPTTFLKSPIAIDDPSSNPWFNQTGLSLIFQVRADLYANLS